MGTTFTPGSNSTPGGNSRADPTSRTSAFRPPQSTALYHFGPFEFRAETGELWKHGIRLKLQSKPAQVLQILLEHPGELVTRDMIRHKLWPEGTYVDFEGGINTATNRLRAMLADNPDDPTYIETIPRLGYRFIYPIQEFTQPSIELPVEEQVESKAPAVEFRPVQYTSKPLAGLSRPTLIAAVFAAVVLVISLFALHSAKRSTKPEPNFQPLTFRPGNIASARFMPDRNSVVYTTVLQGGARQTTVVNTSSLRSEALDKPTGLLTGISSQGDLVLLDRSGGPPSAWKLVEFRTATHQAKTLAVAAAFAADTSPRNSELAIVRREAAASMVEFPRGHVIFQSPGWISDLRVSPSGDQVAFLEHPVRDDDAGFVRMADKNGTSTLLTSLWSSSSGLAWAPSGSEIWFSASKDTAIRAIHAVDRRGRVRLVFRSPSSLRVLDFAPSGKLLVALDDERLALFTGGLNTPEFDASQFDCSHVEGISTDGTTLLVTECGTAAGKHYNSYIRNLKTKTTSLLSGGRGLDLSADGQWAITIDPQERKTIVLRRTSSPDFRVLSGNGFEYQWAKFLPGGQEILVGGSFPGANLKIYRQTLRDAQLREVRGMDYMDDVMVSRVDTKVAGVVRNEMQVSDWSTGKLVSSSPLGTQLPVAWAADGHATYSLDPRSFAILRNDLCSGKVETWKALKSQDAGQFSGLGGAVAAPEAGVYAYSARFTSSRLYLVSGLG